MELIINGIGIVSLLIGWLAPIIGVVALIVLSITDSQLPSSLGWVILILIMINFSATSALSKDARENGVSNQNSTVKSWIVIGLLARVATIVLSLYTLFNS